MEKKEVYFVISTNLDEPDSHCLYLEHKSFANDNMPQHIVDALDHYIDWGGKPDLEISYCYKESDDDSKPALIILARSEMNRLWNIFAKEGYMWLPFKYRTE